MNSLPEDILGTFIAVVSDLRGRVKGFGKKTRLRTLRTLIKRASYKHDPKTVLLVLKMGYW